MIGVISIPKGNINFEGMEVKSTNGEQRYLAVERGIRSEKGSVGNLLNL